MFLHNIFTVCLNRNYYVKIGYDTVHYTIGSDTVHYTIGSDTVHYTIVC